MRFETTTDRERWIDTDPYLPSALRFGSPFLHKTVRQVPAVIRLRRFPWHRVLEVVKFANAGFAVRQYRPGVVAEPEIVDCLSTEPRVRVTSATPETETVARPATTPGDPVPIAPRQPEKSDQGLDYFILELGSWKLAGMELRERLVSTDALLVVWRRDYEAWLSSANRWFATSHPAHYALFQSGANVPMADIDGASDWQLHDHQLEQLKISLTNLDTIRESLPEPTPKVAQSPEPGETAATE